jgi:hypothetical protein
MLEIGIIRQLGKINLGMDYRGREATAKLRESGYAMIGRLAKKTGIGNRVSLNKRKI